MFFQIVTDSSSNLPDDVINRYNLHIITLLYHIGGTEHESYVKNKNNNLSEFYARMRNKEHITTSCCSPATCRSICENILQSGEDILYIGVSSGLSATFETCSAVLEELKILYPERKIYYVDSLAASLGEGLLVTHAAKLRAQGQSIEQVYEWLMQHRLKLCHWFTVDDLYFLHRGGRVTTSSAIVGTMLQIKPVLHMDNHGKLVPVEKVRSRKKAIQALFSKMEKTAIHPENQSVYISHADCLDDASFLAESILNKFGVHDILLNLIDPVIGAHSGPGTLALFFIGTER